MKDGVALLPVLVRYPLSKTGEGKTHTLHPLLRCQGTMGDKCFRTLHPIYKTSHFLCLLARGCKTSHCLLFGPSKKVWSCSLPPLPPAGPASNPHARAGGERFPIQTAATNCRRLEHLELVELGISPVRRACASSGSNGALPPLAFPHISLSCPADLCTVEVSHLRGHKRCKGGPKNMGVLSQRTSPPP